MGHQRHRKAGEDRRWNDRKGRAEGARWRLLHFRGRREGQQNDRVPDRSHTSKGQLERCRPEPCRLERCLPERCQPERCQPEPCQPERCQPEPCLPERCLPERCLPERCLCPRWLGDRREWLSLQGAEMKRSTWTVKDELGAGGTGEIFILAGPMEGSICTMEWTEPDDMRERADLIVRAVNSHAALLAVVEELQDIGLTPGLHDRARAALAKVQP